MAHPHDSAYRQLFSHPEMVADLLRAFIPADWLSQLELGTLERVSGSYVGEEGAQRHSDMVWKVRVVRVAGQWLYLYLLLEFQSTPDPWMALRMQVYIGLMYQDLVKRHELPAAHQLPPVLPLVLYSGARRWTGSPDLADLIAPCPVGMETLQAQQRYLLLDVLRLLRADPDCSNIVVALLCLRQQQTPQQFEKLIASIARWVKGKPVDQLQRSMLQWIRSSLPERSEETTMNKKGEAKMKFKPPDFDAFIEQISGGWRMTGKQEILLRMLERRFGALPESYARQMEEATEDRFNLWADRVAEGLSLDEIFADGPDD